MAVAGALDLALNGQDFDDHAEVAARVVAAADHLL
jgi:hypothetical protein